MDKHTHTHTYKSLDHTPKHTEELSGRASSLFLSTFNVGVSELLFKAKISQYAVLGGDGEEDTVTDRV